MLTETEKRDADFIAREHAAGEDAELLDGCPSYDYQRQVWREWSDHAHVESDDGPLLFCGADLVSCPDAHSY